MLIPVPQECKLHLLLHLSDQFSDEEIFNDGKVGKISGVDASKLSLAIKFIFNSFLTFYT